MRIAIDALNIRAGGGLTHLREFIAAIPATGRKVEVTVVVTRRVATKLPSFSWLSVVVPPRWASGLLAFYLWRPFRFDSVLARLRPDVLFVPGGVYLGSFRPFVSMAQNLLPFEPRERAREGLSLNRLRLHVLEHMQSRSFLRAAQVIHMSEQARQIIDRRAGLDSRRTTVVYHGVNPRFQGIAQLRGTAENRPAPVPFRWLYVSIVEVYKHQAKVAEAAGLLLREGLALTLDFVGPGAPRFVAPLQAAIRAADPAGKNVRYHGPISYDSIEKAYGDADGFVFASSCETFGMIVVEAMAAGLPMVASNRPAIPEIVGDAGLLCDPEDPVSIAAAMRRVMTDDGLRRDLVSRAVNRAAQFTWRKCASETLACLESAWQQQPSGTGKTSDSGASEVNAACTKRNRLATADQSGLRVLSGESWKSGFLDYSRQEDQWRVRPVIWCLLIPVAEQYFVPERGWRLLWDYTRRVGVANVWRKVRSRLQERDRNEKYLSVGIGVLEEGPKNSGFAPGETVVFLASNHPRCVDRLVLEKGFLRCIDAGKTQFPASGIRLVKRPSLAGDARLTRFAGWSSFSGEAAPGEEFTAALLNAARELLAGDGAARDERVLPTSPDRPAVVAIPAKPGLTQGPRRSGKTACLFGYGNYAKTALLTSLDARLQVTKVFEIDPLQLGDVVGREHRWGFSTASRPDASRQWDWDAYFIAGYHHTHGPLAVEALRRGAYAVIEKPVVTTREQLDELRAADARNPGRIFTCFQKRYSPVNAWIREDLACGEGEPLHYSCQVFEVPLPALHWYRWPNSRSRLVSNGIHWIDHFLFLNRGSAVQRRDAQWLQNGEVLVTIELANSACFTMLLTDIGSSRIGVREHVEIKSGGRRAVITDSASYVAEDSTRVLRRRTWNPLGSYPAMYAEISRRIADGEQGESEIAFQSAAVVLELEECDKSRVIASAVPPKSQLPRHRNELLGIANRNVASRP